MWFFRLSMSGMIRVRLFFFCCFHLEALASGMVLLLESEYIYFITNCVNFWMLPSVCLMIWFIQYRIRLRKCRNCHFVRPIWPNFAFISKTIIPHFLLVCIFDLLSSFWIQRYAITPCSDGDIALMPKLCEKYAIFGWFFMIFGTFRAHIWPHILSRHHINDYFIFGTLNRVCTKE